MIGKCYQLFILIVSLYNWPMTNLRKLLLIGCGDIPQRMLKQLNQDNPVTAFSHLAAVRRSHLPIADTQMIYGDASDAEVLAEAMSEPPDQVVVTLTPDGRSLEDYTRTYLDSAKNLCAVAASLAPQARLIFISSTSVYHQNQGEWISAESPTKPVRETARVLLDAEREFMKSANPASVVRFSGIYGPGRDALIRKVGRGQFTRPELDHWSNRIHADDCGALLAFLMAHYSSGAGKKKEIWLASDGQPVALSKVERWIADKLGVAHPDLDNSELQLAGKRCDHSQLLRSGFKLRFPDYQQGYAPLLASD